MRVRQKAQFELARRDDVQTLAATARDASAGLGRLHGHLGHRADGAARSRRIAAQLAEFLG